MKICVQRVGNANLKINEEKICEIGKGLVAFVGFTSGDDEEKMKKLLDKVLGLRIFEDENGKMNLSYKQVDGNIMFVPNFTLYADTNKGYRPSFVNALIPDEARILFERFKTLAKEQDENICFGVFGADMQIQQVNDGPITVIIEK